MKKQMSDFFLVGMRNGIATANHVYGLYGFFFTFGNISFTSKPTATITMVSLYGFVHFFTL